MTATDINPLSQKLSHMNSGIRKRKLKCGTKPCGEFNISNPTPSSLDESKEL